MKSGINIKSKIVIKININIQINMNIKININIKIKINIQINIKITYISCSSVGAIRESQGAGARECRWFHGRWPRCPDHETRLPWRCCKKRPSCRDATARKNGGVQVMEPQTRWFHRNIDQFRIESHCDLGIRHFKKPPVRWNDPRILDRRWWESRLPI